MSTIEEFESAPVGATATDPDGDRAMRIGRTDHLPWVNGGGVWLDIESMVRRGYVLDPLPPSTAREALDLAWELAHPVKKGQVLPEGTAILARTEDGYQSYELPVTTSRNTYWGKVRTLDPLPDPEPDWLDAPAVLARHKDWDRDEPEVFTPAHEVEGHWVATFAALSYHWSDLRDVTPLYPKEQDA